MNRISKEKAATLLPFLIFIAFILFCILIGRLFSFDLTYFQNYFTQYPPILSGFIFIFMYVGLTTFIWFGPKDVLRIAAALIFGGITSTIFISIAEVLNAAILFILARRLGQGFVEEKFRLKTNQLEGIKKETSFLTMSAWRLNPLIPFRFLDLGFGLSRVSLSRYILIVCLLTPFRVYWLQMILAEVGGQVFKDPMKVGHVLNDLPGHMTYTAVYFAVVIILMISAGLKRLTKTSS